LQSNNAYAVSKTMPVKKEVYVSNVLFPFFDGLIPEGWLLDLAETNWKINHRDRFGLLLACCKNCIGAVSVQQMEKDEELQK
jgi:serine/threonine-protein kinase HipA